MAGKIRDTLSNPELVELILAGATKAGSTFRLMTGFNWPLAFAPESFVQAQIGAFMGGRDDGAPWISLESTVGSVLRDAGGEARGRPFGDKALGRLDIVVWWKDAGPRAAIEVKSGPKRDSIQSDCKRLAGILGREDTKISAAFSVVSLCAARKKKLFELANELAELTEFKWNSKHLTDVRSVVGWNNEVKFETTIVLHKYRRR